MSTTKELIEKHAQLYKETTQHVLTAELCEGTLNDRTLYIYLAQDLKFFETSLRFICKLTSLAPETHSLITLAKKIGFFANDENTYFIDCLKELHGSIQDDSERSHFDNDMIPGVDKYIKFIEQINSDPSMTYAQCITILWTLEQIYLSWAHDLPKTPNLHWKHQTWIDLHDGDHFISWCDFLSHEVDKFNIGEVEQYFVKVLNFEYDFFESCYNA